MNSRKINAHRVILHEHVISWAGKCPWTDTLSFGTNEGTFHILPKTPATQGVDSLGLDVAEGGAINGVAFSGNFAVFSTPAQVVLGTQNERISHSFVGGAHGVAAVPEWGFVAALGDDGILCLSVNAENKFFARVARHLSTSLYFYKIVPLARETNKTLLVCAARQDGLLAITMEDDARKTAVIRHKFCGRDIVDVCLLNDPAHPHAVACLSRSNGIFIVPDVFSSEAPNELRLAETTGTAYALVAALNHLFLLTDKEFICLPHEVSGILNQIALDKTLPASSMRIDASEMFLIGNDLVALLANDGAVLMDADEVIGISQVEPPPFTDGKIEQVSFNVVSRQCTSERFAWQDSTLDLILEAPVLV